MKRFAARSIADFEVEEKAYKIDWDIAAKTTDFLVELQRLSLLGVGLYGFLIAHVALKDGSPTLYMKSLQQYSTLFAWGVGCFAVAGACSLIAGFLSINCVNWQIDILRMFGRLDSCRWAEQEQSTNREFAKYRQRQQGRWLAFKRVLMFLSSFLLGTGAISSAILFWKLLLAS
jgi:hypothetical protein